MKLKSSILLAYRLLFPRTGKKSNARKSLMGAFICIGISLVPLVMVMTISSGMIQGITERTIGLSTSHIQLGLYDSERFINDDAFASELLEKISGTEGVVNVYPEIQGIGLAASSKGRYGTSVRAVKDDSFSSNTAFRNYFKVISGQPDLSKANSIIIGKKLAEDLNVTAGNTIRLITTRETADGKTIPKISPMKVAAVVSCGYQELDAVWTFVSLQTGKKIMSAYSSKAVAGIETENAFGIELEKVLKNLMDFKDAGIFKKWSQINSAQFENYASTQIMLIFIMMLIVLVASVNISSALVMLVIERKKEIAIIKSLGGTSGGIAISFVLTGFCTGLAGVLTGVPLGLLCSVNFNSIIKFIEYILNYGVEFFYMLFGGEIPVSKIHILDPAFYLQDIPLIIPLGQLLIVAVGTLVLSLLVSAVPALKAGREKPIETLRKI